MQDAMDLPGRSLASCGAVSAGRTSWEQNACSTFHEATLQSMSAELHIWERRLPVPQPKPLATKSRLVERMTRRGEGRR